MTTTRPRLLAVTVIALGMLGCLTGCGDAQAGKPTKSASPTPTPTATPTTAPAPAPSATPDAATCENLLNTSTLSGFTTGGFTITPTPDFEAKLHEEGNYLANFFDAGGVACQVGAPNGYNASEAYGWAPFVGANAAAITSALTAEGWMAAPTSGGTAYSPPEDSEEVVFRCVITTTHMACAIDDARLAEILANAPS